MRHRQNQGEALKDYFQRFEQLKAKAPYVPKDVAIEAAHLVREKSRTIKKLYSEFEKYCRSDKDLCRRLEEQTRTNNTNEIVGMLSSSKGQINRCSI